jgi:tRNA(Glu) U13 pseudouridine synthase TruD
MFNRLLSDRLGEGALVPEAGEYFCGETLGFPDVSKAEADGWVVGKLIGYNSPANEREKALMGGLGIKKEDFRIKALPEIASKGSYRALLAPLRDFNVSGSESSVLAFRFSLPSGSYATMAMREFMDKKGE